MSKTKNSKSLKGKKGTVGAPTKKTTFPKTSFTFETLFTRNENQCELSIRNKVKAGIKAGTIYVLQPKKQPNKAVGRPKDVFVLQENYDANKHVLAGSVKTPKLRKTNRKAVSVSTTPVQPATAPIVVTEPPLATPIPASSVATIEAPVETAPEVTSPVETVATVEAPQVEAVPTSEPVVA